MNLEELYAALAELEERVRVLEQKQAGTWKPPLATPDRLYRDGPMQEMPDGRRVPRPRPTRN